MTIGSRFREVAAANPDHPALMTEAETWTYGALAGAVSALAATIAESGSGPGPRIAVALPNGPSFVMAFLAVAHQGGIVVPLNPALREPELAALMGDADVSLILTNAELLERCEAALGLASGPDVAVLNVDRISAAAPGRSGAGQPEWPEGLEDPNRPVLFLYSSGSTGRPKRIERSHFNLLYETERLTAALGFSRQDRVLGVAPFSHVNGLTRSMLASMLSGATLVPHARYERREVARSIEDHRISIFIGVPFMFAVLAETRWPREVDFSSLRHCISSSAPLQRETSESFHQRYGIHVLQLYGTSETGTIALNQRAHPGLLESVGLPIPGVEVEVFTETGDIAPPEEEGDIGICSPAATMAYPGLPEATAEAFRGGYFFPGDVGRKDENGNIFLVGRKSLFINRGGYKVNPYEVEQLLERHPRVRQAAVVGVETPYGDEQVKAVVIPDGPCDRGELIAFCRDRLADFKIPSMIEFRTELPTSATGKILRTEL